MAFAEFAGRCRSAEMVAAKVACDRRSELMP
jgi:hypothetical protein